MDVLLRCPRRIGVRGGILTHNAYAREPCIYINFYTTRTLCSHTHWQLWTLTYVPPSVNITMGVWFYDSQNTIVGFFKKLLDVVAILGVSLLMVDFGMSRLNLTFGCDNKRSRTWLQEINSLCYLLSHGIITIFRLILSLDYIEDYIT